ncbi:hypothetical protein [Nocardia sp. NPDC050710]|uniref:hypothetical protein n=1 Tax=Nocardia sp. NPDC050710 TaxID=3157220 RepID=UPI0033F9B556
MKLSRVGIVMPELNPVIGRRGIGQIVRHDTICCPHGVVGPLAISATTKVNQRTTAITAPMNSASENIYGHR